MSTFRLHIPKLHCSKVIVIKQQPVTDLYSVCIDDQEPNLFNGRTAAQSFVFRMIEAYCEMYGPMRIRKSMTEEPTHQTAKP